MFGSSSVPLLRHFVCLVAAAALLLSGAHAQSAPALTGRVSILDFGGKGDGVTDNTPAFNAAVVAAMPKSFTIFIPCGVFRLASRPDPIGTGIKLVGCGSAGSTVGYGSSLVADYDETSPEEAFLTWNGANGGGACCAGTGGGLEMISVFKGAAKSGGTAIKITGVDDGHRAGYTTISDVLVGSIGGGTWDHNLIIDGSCCVTPGTQGVRDTYINNFWAGQATWPDQSILLRAAVQVFWHGGEVMPARVGANSGITLTGGTVATQQSFNIFISDVYVAGTLTVSNATNISFRGYVGGAATIDKTTSNLVLAGIIGGAITNGSPTATLQTNQILTLPQGKQIVASGLATGSSTSTDLAGQLKLVAGKGSYKFTHSYSTAPICVAQDMTAPKPVAISITNLGFSLTGFATDAVSFICIARR
jgi:hypothetical protein